MKKIYTVLFSALLFGSAFAQYGQRNEPVAKQSNDAYGYGYEKYDRKDDFKRYIFTPRERNQQIAEINQEIDYKIRILHSRFFWNRYEKRRHIRLLEEQRSYSIQQVLQHFNDPRNRFEEQKRKRDFKC